MKQCKTVGECWNVVTTDAYDEYEQASCWYISVEEIFAEYMEVEVLGQVVKLEKFDLGQESVVAVCVKQKHKTKVALESVKFPHASSAQALWLKAWKK